MTRLSRHLVRLRARPDTLYLSRGRTVLATGRDGFIGEPSLSRKALSGPEHPRATTASERSRASWGADEASHGLFVHETRLLSRHVIRVGGVVPQANALSNVE